MSTYKRLVEMRNDPFSPTKEQRLILFGMARITPSHTPHTALSFCWFSSETPPRQKGCVPGLSALTSRRVQLGQQKEAMSTEPTQQQETDRRSRAMHFAKRLAKEKPCQAAEWLYSSPLLFSEHVTLVKWESFTTITQCCVVYYCYVREMKSKKENAEFRRGDSKPTEHNSKD